ncbi:importin alpha, putative, partial [Perkinsus marinus ATCC 50983]
DATVQIREEGKEDQLVRRRRLEGPEMEGTAEADFKTLSKPATHVIDCGLLGEVSGMILGAKKDEILREAVGVVCNLRTSGTPAQVRYIVEHNKGITAICTVLDVRDSRMVLVVLEAIEGILKVGCEVQEETGENINRYLEMEECGGLSKIEELQQDGRGVGVDWEVELFMADRRLVDCSLKDLLADQQIAWWLVGCTAVYAVLSMVVIPTSLAVVTLAVMGIGAVYVGSYCGVEPLDPAHKLLFPGLHRKTDGDIVAWERRVETPEIEDTGERPEVTPRNPLESGSKVKMSIGYVGDD